MELRTESLKVAVVHPVRHCNSQPDLVVLRESGSHSMLRLLNRNADIECLMSVCNDASL